MTLHTVRFTKVTTLGHGLNGEIAFQQQRAPFVNASPGGTQIGEVRGQPARTYARTMARHCAGATFKPRIARRMSASLIRRSKAALCAARGTAGSPTSSPAKVCMIGMAASPLIRLKWMKTATSCCCCEQIWHTKACHFERSEESLNASLKISRRARNDTLVRPQISFSGVALR
jgi:hypothetical protein